MRSRKKANEINDGIDRACIYPPYIMELLNTAEVQRMRGIMQNGFSSIAYPNLTHSRHVHLIGTAKRALQLWRSAVANSPHVMDHDSAKVYEQCIASAAVLHDIGHSPFSHDLESLMTHFTGKSHEQVAAEMIVGEYSLYNFYYNVPASIIPLEISKQIRGVLSPMKSISDILISYCIPPETVAQIIDKKRVERKIEEQKKEKTKEGEPQEKIFKDNISTNYFLRESIDGKVIDADKLDYLQRDRRNAGITETGFEPEGIIASVGLIEWNGGIHLGISDKGIEMVNQLLTTRAYMYSRCYTHKTTLKIQAMVYEACKRVLRSLGSSAKKYGSSLHLLDDAQFQTFILTHATNSSEGAQLYLQARYDRDAKYEIAYGIEAKDVSGPFDTVMDREAEIVKRVFAKRKEQEQFGEDAIRDMILAYANAGKGRQVEAHEVIVYFPYGSLPEIEKKTRDFELYVFDQKNPSHVYLASERLASSRCNEPLRNAFQTFCRPQTSYYFMVLCPKEIVSRIERATKEYVEEIVK